MAFISFMGKYRFVLTFNMGRPGDCIGICSPLLKTILKTDVKNILVRYPSTGTNSLREVNFFSEISSKAVENYFFNQDESSTTV